MPTENHLTLYELSQTPEFGRLSPQQAAWVMVYAMHFIDTGTFDALAATLIAFACKNEETARTFSYQLLAKPKLILTLNRFFCESPEGAFLKAVERAVYARKISPARVRALELWQSGILASKAAQLVGA